jgi:uncharacterized protein DUF4307
MTDLDARYGRRRRQPLRRMLVLATAAVAVAVALSWLAWAAVRGSSPAVDGGVVSFDVVSANAVRVTVEVVRDPSTPAVCVLRARDASGEEVGRREVRVPTGGGRRRVLEWTVPTRGRAVTGELESCSTRS